jgi:hypothetical protein
MEADAGEDPTVLGPTTTMIAAQPMLTASIAPKPHLELYAGMSIGAAQLVDGVCTDMATSCNGPTQTATAATYGTELGARIEWQGPPLVVSMGVDGVQSRGWYAGAGLALETSP